MRKMLTYIIVAVLFGIIAFKLIVYFFILEMGNNFVHDAPASQEYYDHVSKRIHFKTKFSGDDFDQSLDSFLAINDTYTIKDNSIFFKRKGDCNCDCFTLQKTIYFNRPPEEAYVISYDAGKNNANQSGIVDIVMVQVDSNWVCVKTSQLDSSAKQRIRQRLDTEIVTRLQ